MGSKTIKTALVVGAIAVGFAAIPAIGPSAFASKVGAFVAPSLGGTAQGLIGTFLVSAGTQLVMGAVNRKLAPEVDLPEIGTNLQQGTMVTAKSGIAPHRVIYGKTRVGGVMVYAEATGSTNEFLHIVIAIAGHEINNITKIFFNENEVPTTQDGSDSNGIARLFPSSGNQYEGKARFKVHTGADAQLADADLVSEITQWTTNHRLRGTAYLYARINFDSDVYPNGVPNITFEVEGKKVFDPRSSGTAFSTNPALCIRDYLLNTDYGLGADTAEVNDTNISSVANTCDESVSITNPSGTESRFTINGTFTLDKSPKTIIQNMLSSVAGHLVYSNGQFKIRPAIYETPTVTLDENDLRTGITLNTRISKKELFNAVKGLYSEPDNNYQPQDYPVLTNSTFETEDNSERIFGEFNFPMTTSSHTVQRLAKIQLLKARQQISFVADFNLDAFELDIGDTVQITNTRLGFSSKTFEVSGWSFSMNQGSDSPIPLVSCEFRETASAVYDFSTSDYSTVSSGKATNLPNANTVSAPSGLTLTDELVQYNDGTVIVKLVINFTAPTDNFTEIFEVEVKQVTDADGNSVSDDFKLIGRGTRTKYEFLNVIDKAEYQVRVRGVNIFGVKSSTITGNRTIIGQIAPPSDVENFACNIIGKEAHLSFDPVTDLDLSHYRINFAPVTTGAQWQNSIVLVKKLSRPGTSIVVPARTGTYLIKAVDKLGNVSINAAEVVTQVTTLGANFTSLITQDESPDFSGTKTDVVKTTTGDANTPCLVIKGNQLFDDVTGNFDSITQTLFDGGQNATVKSSGTYDFASVIDAGAVLTTQISATLTQQVTDRARIFDFVTGDFDDQPSNFDGDANTQCSSELQIAVSDDNVTYSTFQDFTIGDYTGRFFKFRVLMQSDNNTATPIVTAVGVVLQLEEFQTSENDVVSGTGTKAITYPRAFNILNSIAITLSIQDMASGDKYAITSKSKSGFNIAFTNSGGTGVSRTFDYVAKGV
jgi:hypothetical protein